MLAASKLLGPGLVILMTLLPYLAPPMEIEVFIFIAPLLDSHAE